MLSLGRLFCLVGDNTMNEDIKKSDDGNDGQWRGANQRRRDGTRQAIGLTDKVLFLEECFRGSFTAKTL